MIYFLRCEQDTGCLKSGWIKIGTSTRLSMRIRTITGELGHTPTLLAICDGAFAEERALHAKFVLERHVGEWFEPSSDLLRLIEIEGRPWDGTDEAADVVPVKIDTGVLADARIAAAYKGMSLAEYISESLRPIVAKDIEEGHAQGAKTSQPRPKGPK